MKFKFPLIAGLVLLTSCSQIQSIVPVTLSDQEKAIGTLYAKTLCLSNEVQTSLAAVENKDDEMAINQVTAGYQTKMNNIDAEAEALGLTQASAQKFNDDIKANTTKRPVFVTHVSTEASKLCNLSSDNPDLQSFIKSMEQKQQTQQVQPTQQGQ